MALGILTMTRYATRPPPPPPIIQTSRRETDDRHNPRSPAVRDSGDDRYKRRGPISPRSSYGPGTVSYRDDKGSRQSSYNSKDGKHYDSGSSYAVSERVVPSSRSAPTPALPTKEETDAAREKEELWRYFKQVDQDSMALVSTTRELKC